ncbi:hypothetical protein ACFQ3P_08680 [Paraburkholderia sabiae]|uniref:Uncharacterized protein n=1 Tax=Paraburkholderia sabiae TaxID=273251 RepID=A0ABU9Q4T2_9BURK|nr:hypothetical protein [Paraburkholderia sabiae]WJZ71859.1 hypothetical protein QEN71_16890 [Paraburkholderia sabiae]
MMRFTLGTPDRVVDCRTRRSLFPLPVISLDGLPVTCAFEAIRALFHLWAYVSPMESIESQMGEQKSFCDGENPHLSDAVQCRTRAHFMRSNPLFWPVLRASDVAEMHLSVFSLAAQNFYFVRPNRLL